MKNIVTCYYFLVITTKISLLSLAANCVLFETVFFGCLSKTSQGLKKMEKEAWYNITSYTLNKVIIYTTRDGGW